MPRPRRKSAAGQPGLPPVAYERLGRRIVHLHELYKIRTARELTVRAVAELYLLLTNELLNELKDWEFAVRSFKG